ncbi:MULTISPECIES: hypothetical protein [unclassified Arthrobacter]|uniref:hypothetical protein n=1 Tax=unclassified Arthrobacter TaxID=235627 RepID=UPI0011B0153A|nr:MULTISPECIES: hypothetical protein [unclassified Arthrobacter]
MVLLGKVNAWMGSAVPNDTTLRSWATAFELKQVGPKTQRLGEYFLSQARSNRVYRELHGATDGLEIALFPQWFWSPGWGRGELPTVGKISLPTPGRSPDDEGVTEHGKAFLFQ